MTRWPPHDERILELLREALADGSWSAYHGEWIDRLEATLRQSFSAAHIRLTCSGTIAVELALRGVGVTAEHEVILAGYDFPGNFRAIEAIGARPVLVDVAPGGWTIDVEQLEPARTSQTRAVIISHLHGQLAPVARIRAWCDDHDVALVEDACQVPGASIAGRPAGAWGDVAALSFGGSKLLTAGRGGAVLTSSDAIVQRITVFADRGNDAFPLSQLQATALLPQLDSLADDTRRRASAANRLRERLKSTPGISLPDELERDSVAAYYKLGFQLLETDMEQAVGVRARFLEHARTCGLPIGEGFRGFHLRSRRRCRKVGELPHTRSASERTVLLHHTALLRDEAEIDRLAHDLSAAIASVSSTR